MKAGIKYVRLLGVRPFGWGDPPHPSAIRWFLVALWGTGPAEIDRRLRN